MPAKKKMKKKKVKKTLKKKPAKKRVKRDTYNIKGEAGDIRVMIPKEVSEGTRRVILETLKYSMSKEFEAQAMQEIDRIGGVANTLMDQLKRDALYSKDFEKIVRKMIGIYLNRGVQLGKTWESDPYYLMEIIQLQHPDIKKELNKLPKEKRRMAEYIVHSFILGKQCYEAGMSISALLTLDKQEKYKKKLEKETDTYIW